MRLQKLSELALLPQLQAPLLGVIWVLFHVALGWLGFAIGRLNGCAVLLGALDGAILSLIAVARASERFQAGVTGFLSGVSLDYLASGQTIITKAALTIHGIVDSFLNSFGTAGDEVSHKAIEGATVAGVWIAIIVVLAALIINFTAVIVRVPAARAKVNRPNKLVTNGIGCGQFPNDPR